MKAAAVFLIAVLVVAVLATEGRGEDANPFLLRMMAFQNITTLYLYRVKLCTYLDEYAFEYCSLHFNSLKQYNNNSIR